MALYLGNKKIASLSQTITPDMVGNGLSVGSDGKLMLDPAQVAETLGDIIRDYSSDEGDEEDNPVDSLVDAIWSRLQAMSTEGKIEGGVGTGGNMIDTRSNPKFYIGMRPISSFVQSESILTGYITTFDKTY